MKPVNPKDKEKILNQLEKQYGIKAINGFLLKFGKEKIRLFTGDININELEILDQELRIENAGLYILKYEHGDIRLTFDSLTIFKYQISKNIIELDNKTAEEWLKGYEIYIKSDKTWKILKHNQEFIGCGKSTGEKITNFLPKERRIR